MKTGAPFQPIAKGNSLGLLLPNAPKFLFYPTPQPQLTLRPCVPRSQKPTMPLREIERLKLNHEKCCIFTRDGELLWRSPAWGQPPNSEHSVLGARWQEFVCDLPRVLRWLDHGKERTITFHAMLPVAGSHAVVTYAKAALGEYILVFGEATVVNTQLPAPACMAPEALQTPTAQPNKTP